MAQRVLQSNREPCRARRGLILGSLLCAAAAGLGGCADVIGSGDGFNPAPGAGPGAADAHGATCRLQADYGDLGSITAGRATVRDQPSSPAPAKYISYGLVVPDPLQPAGAPDVLFVDFWDGYGVFQNGLFPGTYEIAGVEGDAFQCGVCLLLAADYNGMTGRSAHTLMAQRGTVKVDLIDPTPGSGGVSGSLSDVLFVEVDLGSAKQAVVAGGCKSRVGALSFALGMAQGR